MGKSSNKCGKITIAILITFAWVLLLLLLPLAKTLAVGQADDVGSFKARLELKGEGPFYVGDSISVDLVIEGLLGTEYSLPEFESKQLGGLELAAREKVKKEKTKDGWKDTVSYRLIGWRAGEYQISGLTLTFHDQKGNEGSAKLKELPIKITSLLPANLNEEEILADGLKSLKKPVGLPPRYQYFWFLIGGLTLMGVIFWLLKKLQTSRRNKVAAIMEQDPANLEPAHLIALRRLDDLKRQKLLEDGEFKLFYDQLSEIAREYMENRFPIRALEMTTEEFLLSLGRKDFLNPAQKKAMAEFLQYSDLVKFAKHQPIREEGDRALKIIYGLIEETKEETEDEI